MELLLQTFVTNNPHAATALMAMGALRLILKPVMVYIEQYVATTPDKADDEKVAKIKASKVYKVLCFVLDYTASVKLPK